MSAAAIVASTTPMPPNARERMVGSGNTASDMSATATVAAENTTVRPAVAIVRRTAPGTSRPVPRSSRKRLTISRP